MKFPARVLLAWGECYCRFTINNLSFAVKPSRHDSIVLDLGDHRITLVIEHITHMFDSEAEEKESCYVICEQVRCDTEYEMVETFDILKSYFGDNLINVDGARKPPRYYKLFKTIRRLWGDELVYNENNILAICAVVSAILEAHTGYDRIVLQNRVELFANIIVTESSKLNGGENISLLKVVAAWDPSIDLVADNKKVDACVVDRINGLQVIDKSKLPPSLIAIL